MKERVLYVSDLDGTLLNNEPRLSDFTRKTLEELMSKGVLFTYATARSYVSASSVLDGFEPTSPSIIYNGTFIRNPLDGTFTLVDKFKDGEGKEILHKLKNGGICPLVYAFIDGKECFSYVQEELEGGVLEFVNEHLDDPRRNPTSANMLDKGEIFHFTCIDSEDKLIPMYESLKNEHQCVYYKEQYSGRWWLEIHPQGATKANAVLKLKHMLGVDKVVCFGDGVNDISMFEVCDECYAPSNAQNEVKKIADAVIESNESDGVAKWLLKEIK